ncbi:MAG: PAS domain S-box protein [Candidatus Nanopelagicales bacterium]
MLEPLSIMRSVRDDDGTIIDFEWTYINRAGAAEMMLPVEGLIGSRLLERLPEHRNGLFDTYVRVVETGEPFEVTELGYDDTWETAEVQPRVFDIRAIRVDDGFAVSWNDVTERVANRAALARSEQLFRRAMQDSAVGMTLVTRDGSFVDVNQAMCDFLGHDADTLMAGHWQEFTHPDDVATEETHLRRLLTGEIDTYRITKRYLHADGSVLVGDLSVSGIRNDDGQITGCVRQVIDMTAQARLVEGLAATTRDFQLLADNISDVVVMYGPDGSVQWASPSLKTFLGIAVENVIGKTTPFIHPDDREQSLRCSGGDP